MTIAAGEQRAAEANVPAALVLGFGNVNEERILRGVEVLGEILSDLATQPRGQA